MVALLLVAASCEGEHNDLQYQWDERRILCSLGFDDYLRPLDWSRVEEQLRFAAMHDSVALMHAHEPDASVTVETIERLLDLSEHHGLDTVTFGELSPTMTPRAGIAIAFDDYAVASWYAQRERLARHRARVTFFVTFFDSMTMDELAMLRELADDGHGIEAHSVAHAGVREFVRTRGAAAYLSDEALPSIQGLRALGYPVTSYAYPHGANVPAVDRELLFTVDRIRVNSRSCPY